MDAQERDRPYGQGTPRLVVVTEGAGVWGRPCPESESGTVQAPLSIPASCYRTPWEAAWCKGWVSATAPGDWDWLPGSWLHPWPSPGCREPLEESTARMSEYPIPPFHRNTV